MNYLGLTFTTDILSPVSSQIVKKLENCERFGKSGPHAMCEIFDTSSRAALVKRDSTSLPHSVASLTRCHMCALADQRGEKKNS